MKVSQSVVKQLIPSWIILVCHSLLMDCCYAGDQYYSSVLEELEFEGQGFKADSWSMAVDCGYLQTHRKDVIFHGRTVTAYTNIKLHLVTGK